VADEVKQSIYEVKAYLGNKAHDYIRAHCVKFINHGKD
jgi:hypothetical protein